LDARGERAEPLGHGEIWMETRERAQCRAKGDQDADLLDDDPSKAVDKEHQRAAKRVVPLPLIPQLDEKLAGIVPHPGN